MPTVAYMTAYLGNRENNLILGKTTTVGVTKVRNVRQLATGAGLNSFWVSESIENF